MAAGEASGLFSQVQFHIVQSQYLTIDEARNLSTLLTKGGAQEHPSSTSQGRVVLKEVTHIISHHSDFPDYDNANDALKAVVKPEWVHASLSKGRLANPRSHSPDPRMIFSGLVISCADLPAGDKDAIIGGVIAMGGLYSSSVTRLVTHIVALNMAPEKCQAVIQKDSKCKIVLPHWLGKRIDEGPYSLPDPEILRKRPEDRVPDANREDLQGASSTQPRLPSLTNAHGATIRRHDVFKEKKVMLSYDLGIGSRLRGTIEDIIVGGGGIVTGSVHKADMFICQYRESTDFRVASIAGNDVGNLAWLYNLITHNVWTSPMKRLLHYPISRNGLPGFQELRISLSNYNGEARVYLENLAKAVGAEFTKTMKEDNTHLITAHQVSEKCDAAKEWNINMVNHLWLEESYAKWQIQTLTNPRYTYFPPRTNLGEIVGQTPIDKKAAERFFFPKGCLDENTSKQGKELNARYAEIHAEQDPGLADDNMYPQSSDYRLMRPDGMTPKVPKQNRGNASVKTPTPWRISADGKENDTPSTASSRGAKNRAAAKLHDQAADIALYEKERKRVGGVIFGGRTKSNEDIAPNGTRKRSASREEGLTSDDENKDIKRSKKTKGQPHMRLLTTGYKEWVDQAKKESEDRGRLREMGIMITQDSTNCTHVASPAIVRTKKFVCALARAPMIISTDFIDDCLAENERLDPQEYRLHDTAGEKRLGFKLDDALQKAKSNKGHLLRGISIFCTENIQSGFDTYKSITEANGGKCLLYRARAGSAAAARAGGLDDDADQMDIDTPDYAYLISGTTPEEAKLWPKFRQMAQGTGKLPRIVRTDWMLDLALRQEIQWHDGYSLSEDDIEMTH
ncbi:MAG: hypothetical protein LQ351_003032 [Letrouitia transgressa]|nr:MAG: hypothetical protein LQ351_003032 [Letrouitia transgressa]